MALSRANNGLPTLPPFASLSRRAGLRLPGAFSLMAFWLGLTSSGASAQDSSPPRHDYPTSARADYVIGCLAANGFQHQKLEACACSIDAIANQMTYDQYEQAGTVLSMQQASVGPRGGLFRDTPVARQALESLRRAQAEANLRCGG